MCPFYLALPLWGPRLSPAVAWWSRWSWWDSRSCGSPVQGSGIVGRHAEASHLELPAAVFSLATDIPGMELGAGASGTRVMMDQWGKSSDCIDRIVSLEPSAYVNSWAWLCYPCLSLLPKRYGDQKLEYLAGLLASRKVPGMLKYQERTRCRVIRQNT